MGGGEKIRGISGYIFKNEFKKKITSSLQLYSNVIQCIPNDLLLWQRKKV